MKLALVYPLVSSRECQTCLKWQYDEATGQPMIRRGEPMKRYTKPMCETDVGCPKGTPDHNRALTEQNRLAWQFHRECEAVGSFPRDAIVRRNAVVIRNAKEWAAKANA